MAAAASPSPVTGTTTTLSALGADDGGEAHLKYLWRPIGNTTGLRMDELRQLRWDDLRLADGDKPHVSRVDQPFT